jgi:tetratricopeptide (TPR) repeat protein
MEQGIRAYGRGQRDEAERLWREALALDPDNERLHSYLALVGAATVDGKPPRAVTTAVPLPAPERTRPADAAEAARPPARQTPVPLPAASGQRPTAPGWMRPPITLPPTAAAAPAPPPAAAAAPPVVAQARTAPVAPPPVADDPFAPAAPAPEGDPFAPRAAARATARPDRVTPAPRRPTPAPGAAPGTPEVTVTERITLTDYAPSPWDQGPALAPSVVLDDGEAGLDLASVEEASGIRPLVPDAVRTPPAVAPPKRPRSEVETWLEGARELFALGDFSGSLEMIEKILRVDPAHAEARKYLEQNEATLTAMYESKLGAADSIPRLAIQPEEVMWLNLDHRAGFLLAQIDGTVSYEDLFAVSGLPRLDTARILATLLQEGVISS